jgi:sugar lactone lactonase YvrE
VDIAADSDGNLYVVENSLAVDLLKITPDGVVSYLSSLPSLPDGVVVDRNGNVFVADWNQITKVSPTGEVSVFAGGRVGSEDGRGLNAQFSYAMRIAIDTAGNFYVSDAQEYWIGWANNTIRKITPDAVVTTFCGVADVGSHDGIGSKARFSWPRGVVSDAAGNLYVADTNNDTIRKITADGRVTTIAGKVQTPGYVDGTGTHARFSSPWMITMDTSGNLYVVDQGNSVIRKITPDLQVTTIANGYIFSTPSGIALDGNGNIYVSESSNHTIDKITPDGQVSIFAGSPGQIGRTDGTGSEARFHSPAGLACDGAGNIYVADFDNNEIRKITPAAVVTTLAGTGYRGNRDGDGSVAEFDSPAGVALDGAGSLYVTDNGNVTLRKITPSAYVTTLAGRPDQIGWIDATGSDARFFSPYGVTVDASGNVYVADVSGQTIRKGSPAP